MSTDLEDRVRASLRQRADAVHVTVPDPMTARRAVLRRRSRRLETAAAAAALVLFVAAGLVVALAGREGQGTTAGSPGPTGGAATGPAPEAGPLARIVDPGALVSMPAPWQLERFSYLSAAASLALRSPDVQAYDGNGDPVEPFPPSAAVEYQFSDGDRSLQVNFYPLGQRAPQITTPTPPLVDVRGTTGYFLDYGGARYRVQWDEGDRTWEADGTGYASLDDFVATVDAILWEDDTEWAGEAPSGLADAVAANPDGSVTWLRGGTPELTATPSAGADPDVRPDGTTGPFWADHRCDAPAPNLVVYLETSATAQQIASLATHLDEDSTVTSYDYLDQQTAYEEFMQLFSDSPEMVASVRPGDLPPSFRIRVSGTAPVRTGHDLAALAGVKDVIVDPCTSASTSVVR